MNLSELHLVCRQKGLDFRIRWFSNIGEWSCEIWGQGGNYYLSGHRHESLENVIRDCAKKAGIVVDDDTR